MNSLQVDSFEPSDYFFQETEHVGDACFVIADVVIFEAAMKELNKERLEVGKKDLTYVDLLTKTISVQETALRLCTELIVRYSKAIGIN